MKSNVVRSERIYSLDVLKIMATVTIVFHHYQQVFEVSWPTGINYYGGELFSGGYMVELFFMLSGFFITDYIPAIQNGKISFGQFMKRRWIRLLPLVAISGAVFEVIVWWGNTRGSTYLESWGFHVSLWGWLVNALGIQAIGMFPNPCINNPTWYVSVLIWLYAIFYMIAWASGRFKSNPIWGYVGMIFLGFCISYKQWTFPFFCFGGMERGYYSFGGGVTLSIVCNKLFEIEQQRKKLQAEILAASALILFLCVAFLQRDWIKDYSNLLITFIIFPSLIILMQSQPMMRICNNERIGALGAITFDVYIWHAVLLCFLRVWGETVSFPVSISSRYTMYLVTLIAFGIGTFSYFFIEIPMNRFLNNYFK